MAVPSEALRWIAGQIAGFKGVVVTVTKGIAVHFATKGKDLYLIDRGGVVRRMAWMESPARAAKSK